MLLLYEWSEKAERERGDNTAWGRTTFSAQSIMSAPCFHVGEKGIKSDKSELLSLQSLFDFDRKMASCITSKSQNIVHIPLSSQRIIGITYYTSDLQVNNCNNFSSVLINRLPVFKLTKYEQ